MTQCFYLVGHSYVGDDFCMDKVFLQEKEAVKWGRRFATANTNYTVSLFKQEITKRGTIKYVRSLVPFPKTSVDNDIDQPVKVGDRVIRAPKETFDWSEFDK